MQVLNAHAGLLSNSEVYQILVSDDQEIQQEIEALSRRRSAAKQHQRARGKFEHGWARAEASRLVAPSHVLELRKQLKTHLNEEHLSSSFQSPARMSKLTKQLGQFGGGTLTRAEKLQIVNGCPVEMVHLFVIVDQLLDRIPDEDERERLLDLVRAHVQECKDAKARGDQDGLSMADEIETQAAVTQAEAQREAEAEKHHEMDIAEEVQEEEEELDEFDEEEEEEEDMLISTNYKSGGGDADLEIDETPEGEA